MFLIFDYGKSGPTHFYLMVENLKAIAQLVPVLEFEANECEKLVQKFFFNLKEFQLFARIWSEFEKRTKRRRSRNLMRQANIASPLTEDHKIIIII
ncbi:MAG: hypothetical protein GY858_04275 [Candidatus Omnitrophica bacterium]|nr:hypothetical protein [Candidatus Omnitrophota bacterium]